MGNVLCIHVEDSEFSWKKKKKREKSVPNGNHHFKNLGNYLKYFNRFHKKKICKTIVPSVNWKMLRSQKLLGILKGTTKIRRWGVSPAKLWKKISTLIWEILRYQGNESIVMNRSSKTAKIKQCPSKTPLWISRELYRPWSRIFTWWIESWTLVIYKIVINLFYLFFFFLVYKNYNFCFKWEGMWQFWNI